MSEYPGMRVDMGGRYGQYVDGAYAQAAAGAPMGGMHLGGGYEWNGGYQTAATAVQDSIMHGGRGGRATAQSLRSKIAERLVEVGRDTLETKERRYQQKGEEIQGELALVLRGAHPAFVEGVARLTENRDRALASAEENHQYLVALYERVYRQEREQAQQAYESEKQAVYDRIAADIDERRRRLKEEKDSLDISVDFVLDSGARTSSKRNLRKRGNDPLGLGDLAASSGTTNARTQYKRKANQPFTMGGLPEDDIVSDLVAIRRATGVTGPLGNGTNGKKGHKGHKR
ncbi:hypothetical protein GGF46_004418 [Coemansia sp. RSA 552]|nr:hypothetical protein GGF46_004418 [Coemansia sp. RSA 552]